MKKKEEIDSRWHQVLCSTHCTWQCLFSITHTSHSWYKGLPFFASLAFSLMVPAAEIYLCLGVQSPLLTPGPAGLRWVQLIVKRNLNGTSVPCALLPLGSGGQEPPAAPSSPCLAHLASSWRSWCCTEGRARHPCPATSPLLQPSHTAAAFKLMLLW